MKNLRMSSMRKILIYLSSYILFTLIFIILSLSFDHIKQTLEFSLILKTSLVFGIIGLMFPNLYFKNKRNKKFWEESGNIEKKIIREFEINKLDKIYDDIDNLIDLSFHYSHIKEVEKLNSLTKMKINTLKKKVK